MAMVAQRDVYEKLGVLTIINGFGSVTRLGGSIMAAEVVDAMAQASRSYVDLDELQRKVGDVIARCTGAEAGYVCAGAAAGLVLATAACVAGNDPAKIGRLPDTSGMKNEVIMHKSQRNGYDHSIRSVGVKIVEIGFANATAPWELDAAIGPNTAAVAYVVTSWLQPTAALPLELVIKTAHARGIPVIVAAAAALPPQGNLTRFVELGADLVTFSGGKGIRGPQSSGILCGRRDLIEASLVQGNPNHAIGRPMKVGKEEMVGLATALELYVRRDHEADFAEWVRQAESIADALQGIKGIYAREVHADRHWSPVALVSFENHWSGRSPDDIATALRLGDPPIHLPSENNELKVSMIGLQTGDAEIVARRLREELF